MIGLAGKDLSHMFKDSPELFQKLMRSCSGLHTVSTLIVAIFLIAAGHWLLSLFGPSYTKAWYILAVLVSGKVVHSSYLFTGRVLGLIGFEKYVARLMGIFAILNIALSIVLAFHFGGLGVALGYFFFSFLAAAFFHEKIFRHSGIRFF